MLREVPNLKALQAMSAEEAAAFWLVRFDVHDTDSDDALFCEWLDSAETNSKAWAAALQMWDGLDDPHIEPAFANLRAEARSAGSTFWTPGHIAIAASLFLAVMSGSVLFSLRPDSFLIGSDRGTSETLPNDVVRGGFLATAKGERRTFILSDKTKLTLNTDSSAYIDFLPHERRIERLHGQAYFEVSKDPKRPFIVGDRARSVTALGTSFEVRADERSMQVILVEGRVKVAAIGAAPVELHAGQQATATTGTEISVLPADLGSVSDWRRGVLQFRDTTLSDAANELNRYSKTRLIVRDPKVAALRVSGVFTANDGARFAKTLEAIHPIRIVKTGADEQEIVSFDQRR